VKSLLQGTSEIFTTKLFIKHGIRTKNKKADVFTNVSKKPNFFTCVSSVRARVCPIGSLLYDTLQIMVIFALTNIEFMSQSDCYIRSHENASKPSVKIRIQNVYADLTIEKGKWENLNH